jgi:hypothetical protein
MTSKTFSQRLHQAFPACPACGKRSRNLYMHLMQHLQMNEITVDKVNEALGVGKNENQNKKRTTNKSLML